jgi:hypothetical protein
MLQKNRGVMIGIDYVFSVFRMKNSIILFFKTRTNVLVMIDGIGIIRYNKLRNFI